MIDVTFDSNWRYAGIEYDDVANGRGMGAVFFTQYCPHHCYNCQNPQTWSKDGGLPFTKNVLNELLTYYNDVPYANRLTLSGGDPMANIYLTYYIIKAFKDAFPNKEVWIYTGYTFEQLLRLHLNALGTNEEVRYAIMKLCDVIVDGKFENDKRDVSLQFRGSKNQRIIDVKKTYENRIITLLK